MTKADPAPFADALRDASSALPPGCQEGFARIVKLIRARPHKFQFLILDCRDQLLRERLIKGLDDFLHAAGRRTAELRLTAQDHPDFAALERRLKLLAETNSAIHVTGGPAWFDSARWEAFNIRRESVAHEVRAGLLFWLDDESISDLARVAIDLWAWRTAVITFSTAPQRRDARVPDVRIIDDRTHGERSGRIEFLRRTLLEPDIPDDIRAGLALELGDLAASTGRVDDAESAYRTALLAAPDERSRAITMGRIADILYARGELDEALRIRREEELPVYERLGDVRSRAVTLHNLAGSLIKAGGLNDARVQEIHAAASEAFAIARQLNLPDAIANTGTLLAQVLGRAGRIKEALPILDEAEAAFMTLGNAAGLERVKEIRGKLTASTG